LDDRGNRIADETLLILLNAHYEPIPFTLPAHRRKVRWEVVLDTCDPSLDRKKRRLIRGGEIYDLKDRSLVMLSLPGGGEGEEKTLDARSALRRVRPKIESRVAP
jgi:glycogen operon protein